MSKSTPEQLVSCVGFQIAPVYSGALYTVHDQIRKVIIRRSHALAGRLTIAAKGDGFDLALYVWVDI